MLVAMESASYAPRSGAAEAPYVWATEAAHACAAHVSAAEAANAARSPTAMTAPAAARLCVPCKHAACDSGETIRFNRGSARRRAIRFPPGRWCRVCGCRFEHVFFSI
jgi:hypothetical protein